MSRIANALRAFRWIPFHILQRFSRPGRIQDATDVVLAIADHFEPAISVDDSVPFAPRDEQQRRLSRWVHRLPEALDPWRDAEGFPLRHTYFYPAEQYDPELVGQLADFCRGGWGEIEVHLHHGVTEPANAQETRSQLITFRDQLVRHGCLSRLDGEGSARNAFVHGNWALANSAGGLYCGVDEELDLLADTGCYADFTLPSAPSPAQISKINAMYECRSPLGVRAAHRRGQDLRVGRAPTQYPLIIQGPLGLWPLEARPFPRPYIENGALSGGLPPTMIRFQRWLRPPIVVQGAEQWLFVKLHCHGMDPRDEAAMFGPPVQQFLSELFRTSLRIHFVTAREMVNVALAACDGRGGDAGQYRDYRFRLISQSTGSADSGSANAPS